MGSYTRILLLDCKCQKENKSLIRLDSDKDTMMYYVKNGCCKYFMTHQCKTPECIYTWLFINLSCNYNQIISKDKRRQRWPSHESSALQRDAMLMGLETHMQFFVSKFNPSWLWHRMDQMEPRSLGDGPKVNNSLRWTQEEIENVKRITRSLYLCVPPVLLLLGSMGNIMSVCVLRRRAMSKNTSFYLTALAVTDLLVLYTGKLAIFRSNQSFATGCRLI